MAIHKVADIRNICLVGHSGAGKTTLTERLLLASGAIKRMGSVEEGNTVSDHTDEERHHKHSLQPSIVHLTHDGHEVNLIDTPGLMDFIGHAIACIPAVETVAVVIDTIRGIETASRRLMAIAEDRKLPRMVIVNKVDHPEAEIEMLVEQVREAFGAICLPINLPTPDGKDVINVFEHDGKDSKGDQTLFSSVHEAHRRIVEQVIEVDEDLTLQYLEKGEEGGFDPAKLHAAFERALEQGHLVPICFCSAKTGVGIDDLLHVFASLCPSPEEVHPDEFLIKDDAGGNEREYRPDPDAMRPLIAHVFKVATDAFVGKLGVFRVHQGIIRPRQDLLLDDQKKTIRIGHMFRLQGKEHVEVHELGPGQIGAVAKIDELRLNSVMHESHDADTVRIKPLPMAKPMYGLAIELKNHADETRFSSAVHKLSAEDPGFSVERIAATRQTVIRGMGELHLRVIIEKLRAMGIEVITSPPKIAYKETITIKANGHHRHKKQTGGAGQFGEVYLTVEPLPLDHAEGFEFLNETVGGSIPRQFIPAVEKGVRQAMVDGAIAGYPMKNICVRVYDGKYHDVDSKEIAFVTAGKKAFIDGIKNARPVLLEPYVSVEITAPSRYMGDITGDLSGKRGRVQSTDMVGADQCLIRATAPLGELQNYSNQLKSMTGGTGTFVMEYSHDEQTPAHIQADVVAAYKPHDED
ncbi:MAG TPA: elongation factor G [Phycisphaerales bacterium]|nr:elongation factor G [Phycisphaerales bacterium]